MDHQKDDSLDSIPMPSSISSSLGHMGEPKGEVIDSWKRAQTALNSMGGGRSTLLQHPPNIPPYGGLSSPCFQGFPIGSNPAGYFPPVYSPYSYPYFPNAPGARPSTTPAQYFNRPPNFSQRAPNDSQRTRFTTPNHSQKVSNFPHIKPVRFIISSNNSGVSTPTTFSYGAGIPYPPAVKEYIERAYAATDEADRPRLEKFLKDRVEPLLKSGAVYAVNWATEPLPHEQNFQVHTSWTPASELKKQQTSPPKRAGGSSNNCWFNATHSSSNESSFKDDSNSMTISFSDKPNGNKLSKKAIKKAKRRKAGESSTSPTADSLKVSSGNWTVVEASVDKKKFRAKRFASERKSTITPSTSSTRIRSRQSLDFFIDVRRSAASESSESVDIVGTCMEVEKPFFRLTSAADPSQIRPFAVLIEALEMVKKCYKTEQNYRYACDQLKSIRQDLMIQNIRNEFTVLVYESNARIALENKDREEFNQCQNQLKALYAEVVPCSNKWEFTSYRLLYYIYMKDILDISSLLDELLPEALKDECMCFALSVWDAWSMSNYVQLFRLYSKAPKMTGYVMDMFVERERKEFCTAIIKAYRPGIEVKIIAKWLGFTETELVEWLGSRGIVVKPGENLDCRQYANTTI